MYIDDVKITPECIAGDGDCNDNGIDDAAEIFKDPSLDCYGKGGIGGTGNDGILDECQCVADWNLDGITNSSDVGEFINTYFSDQSLGTINGDINCDGNSNSTDVGQFINLWFAAQAGQLPYAGCSI